MTKEQQYKLLDELAGERLDWFQYNSIIPLIQKYWSECGYHVSLRDKPSELSEALLRATGKWKD